MAARQEERIGNWIKCISKSTGKNYYFNSIEKQSLWEDKSLPYPWGWKKSSDTSPKIFVNLITGEETEKLPPSGIKRNREDREEVEEDKSLTSNDLTNKLEQELQKYFNVSTIEALCIAGRGKRSVVYISLDRNVDKVDKK